MKNICVLIFLILPAVTALSGEGTEPETGVGVDVVVDLGQVALHIPAELLLLRFLETLKLFDQVDFEFRTDPHSKFEYQISVRVGSAIAASLSDQPDRIGFLHPLFHADLIAVQPGLTFNCGESAIIEIGVVDPLPNSEEFDRISVSKPI